MLVEFEVGIVSSDPQLVTFLSEVFDLERLAPDEYPVGTLHRLATPGAVIKVMVPNDPPAEADSRPFMSTKGLRYLTMKVQDLEEVLRRCRERGGQVVLEPLEFQPGRRIAVIADPDGNTMEVLEAT
jgi:catechol 2,3-dioxygenase-like lactoylglutathione lyase family enzyme